jgi:hypothetical protein
MKSPEPVNPYLPPLARPAKNGGVAAGSMVAGREGAVLRALELLKSGKDQWAVVNDLRSSGLPADDAKRESYPVFDEAKRRLSRSQFLTRVVAQMLIVAGVLIPLGLFLAGGGYRVVSSIPVIVGMGILFRLPNPKRIRPDLMFGPGSPLIR